MTEPKRTTVLVAGDICLDVVGIPVPGASAAPAETDNWRLTGEICTHYLPGGAFQLAEFVRGSNPGFTVKSPIPMPPEGTLLRRQTRRTDGCGRIPGNRRTPDPE